METGPAPFALRPFVGHSAARIGRSLWWLNCFEVPVRDHHAWRHGRCGGVRPTMAMPPGLRENFVRMPMRPDLPEPMQGRWALLVGAAKPAQLQQCGGVRQALDLPGYQVRSGCHPSTPCGRFCKGLWVFGD